MKDRSDLNYLYLLPTFALSAGTSDRHSHSEFTPLAFTTILRPISRISLPPEGAISRFGQDSLSLAEFAQPRESQGR